MIEKQDKTLDSCVSCGCTKWKRLMAIGPGQYAEECSVCGLHRFNPSQNAQHDEFSKINFKEYQRALEGIRKHSFQRVLAYMNKHTKRRRLLDVGCSFGWLLDVAHQHGWDADGIEPSRSAAQHARQKGHNVLEGSFPHASLQQGYYDAITFMDVLEHLPDPVKILSEAGRILSPGGIIVIKLPNTQGIVYRIAYILSRVSGGCISSPAGRLYQIQFPYPHLYYFNESTLGKILERAGFAVVESYKHRFSQYVELSS